MCIRGVGMPVKAHKPAVFALIATLTMALSGCLAGPSPGQDHVDHKAMPGESSVSEPRTRITGEAPVGTLDLTECNHVSFGLTLHAVPHTWPRPDSWPDAFLQRFGYAFYDCERVSWGQYERGPVQILFEGETLELNAYGCTPDRFNSARLVTRVYMDDRELATAWQGFFGDPVSIVEFNFSEEELTEGLNQTRLAWSGESVDASYMMMPHGPHSSGTQEKEYRYIWFNDTSILTLDLMIQYEQPDPIGPAGVAYFGAPSPLAEPIGYEEVGANRYYRVQGAGEITTWDNHDCQP